MVTASKQPVKPPARPAAPPPKATAVSTKVQDRTLVVIQDEPPEYVKATGAGRGSENVGTEDIVIPRLEIIQALSPAVKPGDSGYIEGAKPGTLTNSVTKQLYGNTVLLVPVYYSKQWLVWKKRKTPEGKALEGGFFGAYPSPEEAQTRADAEGGEKAYIEVIDTPQHLCLLIDPNRGTVDEVMLSMPRTKAKISRQWNSMVKLAGGDRFARVYRVGVNLEKNAKGDFYNYSIAQSGFPVLPLYKRAEALYESIQSGKRAYTMDTSGLDPDADPGTGHNEEM